MSNKVLYNIIILAVVWVGIIIAGAYVTMMKQPDELARVEKAGKVIRLKQAELASLINEHAVSEGKADNALNKWKARYKVIPDRLSSPEVIGYLNELTRTGFEVFDVSNSGTQGQGDYSYHSFSVSGRGYFSELYRIVWELENNRYFYRIPELTLVHMDIVTEDEETGNEVMKIMVSFQMQIDAIFSGAEGMSAPGEEGVGEGTDALPFSKARSERPPVPSSVLPSERPELNPFFPLIMDKLPPNTHNLINIEAAKFVSIIGDEAVFQEGDQFRAVGVGDDVYLGQIVDIDPLEGRVKARLNKGGIIDAVELYLQSGEQFQQAMGAVRRAPSLR